MRTTSEQPEAAPGSVASVFYLAGDYNEPSWGIGLIYEHVRLLRDAGIDAFVLHRQRPFRIDWMESDVPIRYLEPEGFRPRGHDLVVIPDVMVADARAFDFTCRRVVLNQGSYFIMQGFDDAFSYRDMGFECSLTIMPHMAAVLQRHFDIDVAIVPPFVAAYFFTTEQQLRESSRSRTILVSGKAAYGRAGYLDHDILRKLLKRELPADWRFVELQGMTHRQVAEHMRQAAFLVNTNTLEAFNTTVPEAMAAGCIPVCYEACGGRDYLENGQNAFVFPNNHVFPLAEKVLELAAGFDPHARAYRDMQLTALATAGRYTEANTREHLLRVFGPLLGRDLP